MKKFLQIANWVITIATAIVAALAAMPSLS